MLTSLQSRLTEVIPMITVDGGHNSVGVAKQLHNHTMLTLQIPIAQRAIQYIKQ